MAMYQSRKESKRSALGTSQQSSGQYNRKKSKGRGYRGRGASWGAISSHGLVRPPCRGDILGSVRDIVQGVSIVARKAISLESALI